MEQGRIGLTPEAIAPSGMGDVAGDADADGCIPWLFPWTDTLETPQAGTAGSVTGRVERPPRTGPQVHGTCASKWPRHGSSRIGHRSESSRREIGATRMVTTGMPPLAGWRDNGRNQGCALSCRDRAGYRDRLTPVTRTSTHTGPPLIENARSLRRTFCRVNLGKTLPGGIEKFFSAGSGRNRT